MSFINTTKYFLSKRNVFAFSGNDIDCTIVYNRSGLDSFRAFREYDEKGRRIIETKHPETLRRLIKTKASLTFQIKKWAEGRADGTLPGVLFSLRKMKEVYGHEFDNGGQIDIETEYNLPVWVVNAVETQKVKFYN